MFPKERRFQPEGRLPAPPGLFATHQTLAPTYQLREPEIVGKVDAGQ
jgi:hypothetical protein